MRGDSRGVEGIDLFDRLSVKGKEALAGKQGQYDPCHAPREGAITIINPT